MTTARATLKGLLGLESKEEAEVPLRRLGLAIEDHRPLQLFRVAGEGSDEIGKLAGLLVTEPRPDAHGWAAAGRDLDYRANAVVLRLVDEPLVLERGVLERGEHGTDCPEVSPPRDPPNLQWWTLESCSSARSSE